MSALAAALHLLGLVLVVSGAQKLVAPGPAAQAMRDAALPGAPSNGAGAIVVGGIEIVVGLSAVVVPEWWAAASLAVVYLAFAAFVVRLRSQDAGAGCGCFGASSAPPGRAHLVLDVSAALVGVAAALLGTIDVLEVFDDGIWVTTVYVALLAIGSILLLLGPALSAELAAARDASTVPTFSIARATGSHHTSTKGPG